MNENENLNCSDLGVPPFYNSLLWAVALKPFSQGLFEQFSTFGPIRNNRDTRSSEIKAMCRIFQHHTEQFILSGAHPAFRDLLCDFNPWCKRKVGGR